MKSMKKANLPLENASEPNEEAHQPPSDDHIKRKKKAITFGESEKMNTQTRSSYKQCLSQPPQWLCHRERLLWLQTRRGVGLHVQCDNCDKWRYLPDVLDRQELTIKWFCNMNEDKSMADCSVAEVPLNVKDEEDLIHNEYTAGSIVWAKMPGWPWWPAMVDDEPDTEQFYWLDGFSDIPTYYNVVFFDETEVTRAWISPRNLKPYKAYKKNFKFILNTKKYKKRLTAAIEQADNASTMPLAKRLADYSFISVYKGPIVSPKKIDKGTLQKIQKKLQKKYKVEIPTEDSDSDEDNELIIAAEEKEEESLKRKNVIIVGKPKAKKKKTEVASKTVSGTDGTDEPKTGQSDQKEVSEADKKPQNLTKEIVKGTLQTLEHTNNSVENNHSEAEGVFKEPDSMQAQPGSLDDTLLIGSEDKSKTQSEMDTNTMDDPDFDITRATSQSSGSGDFEF